MKIDKRLAGLAAVVFIAASLIDWSPGLMAGVGRQTVVLLGLVAGFYWLIRIVIIAYQNGEAVAIGLIGCMLAVAAFAIVFSINHSPAQPAVAGGVSQNSPLVVVTIGAPPAPAEGVMVVTIGAPPSNLVLPGGVAEYVVPEGPWDWPAASGDLSPVAWPGGVSPWSAYDSPPTLPVFDIDWWSGENVTFNVPADVWQYMFEASQQWVCDPRLVVAIAHSEHSQFGNVCNPRSGACGILQFMPGTFPSYNQIPGADRLDERASAYAACVMTHAIGLDIQPTEKQFADRFQGEDVYKHIWNDHRLQAEYVWKLWQKLNQVLPMPSVPSAPTTQ